MAALGQFIILLVFSGMTMKIFHLMAVLKNFRRYVMTSSKDIILTSITKNVILFRGRLHKSLIPYTTCGFGIPLVITMVALSFDESVKEDSQLYRYRPG